MSDVMDWTGFISSLLSIAIIVGAIGLWAFGRNPMVAVALHGDRRRTVGRALIQLGVPRPLVRRAVWASTTGYLAGRQAPQLQTELDWLDGVTSSWGRPVPTAFYGLGDPVATSQSALAESYQKFALRLRSRGLMGGGTSPLVDELAETATKLATILAGNASFSTTPAPAPGVITLELAHGTSLSLDHLRGKIAPGRGVDDVAVSYRRSRLVVPDTIGSNIAELDRIPQRLLRLSPQESESLSHHFDDKSFDSVLPSIDDSRFERESGSGRTRLHCVLSETAFSAMMASHYVGDLGAGRRRSEMLGEANLFTLAALPVTCDNFFVATTRSEYVHVLAGQITPAIAGNLEMRDRTGLTVDRDRFGIPDPLLAVTRELREEFGLVVERNSVEVTGTVRFASDREVGTTALLTTVRLRESLQHVADSSEWADRIEGAWESDPILIGVPVPGRVDDWLATLAWTMTQPLHVPHLVACLVAHAYPELCSALGRDLADAELARLATLPTPVEPPEGLTFVAPRPGRT